MWLMQISFAGTDATAGKPEEAELLEMLKAMIKHCLHVNPQQRMQAAIMAKTLYIAADKAGWM